MRLTNARSVALGVCKRKLYVLLNRKHNELYGSLGLNSSYDFVVAFAL